MFFGKKKEKIDDTVIRSADLNLRMLAVMVDVAILVIIVWPILQSVAQVTYGGMDSSRIAEIMTTAKSKEEAFRTLQEERVIFKVIVDNIIQLTVAGLLVIPCWLKFGATPGKFILRMRVVDALNQKTLTFPRALARFLAYGISMLPLGAGILWIAIDKKKSGLARYDCRHIGDCFTQRKIHSRADCG